MAETDPITTSSDIVQGDSNTVPNVTSEPIDPDAEGTTLGDDGSTLNPLSDVTADQGSTENLNVTPPKPSEGAGQMDDITTVEDIGDAGAAQGGLSEGAQIGNIQGELSEGATATAATQELDPRATTKYQLDELMKSLETGSPMPAWASGPVRKVGAMMAARGMSGGGSMGAAAMVQAIMEAGVPIASADANAYARIQLQNLNNEQATALQNAATVASMDTANLNARMTAAVTNAKAFLSMDLQNLTNEQSAETLTYQAKLQKVLADAGADNARKQMNAKNELQMEEFYAELGAQIESANANRFAAMEQFNVDQGNSMLTYNQTMRDSRERFDATVRFAIDQSNVTWRRDVNTANTATQNETNRINVQNEFNATMSSLNNLWQMYRDNATFNFNKIESNLDREQAVALMGMEMAYNTDLLKKEEKMNFVDAIARFLGNLMRE